MINKLSIVEDILTNMPLDATAVRINRDWGIFYRCDELENSGKFKQPHRYLRYCKNWVPLNIKSWSDFKTDNLVMNAFDFRFLAHKQFFIELKGIEFAAQVLKLVPEGATHYNFLSNMYYRLGGTCAELWTDESHCGWFESSMSSNEADRLLICIETLKHQLNEKSL